MRILLAFMLKFTLATWAVASVYADTTDAPTGKAASVQELRSAIAERLSLMPDVARYKWNAEREIEDQEREKKLLETIVKQAESMEIDPKRAEQFVGFQMMASKRVQADLFRVWRVSKQGKFEDVPDLQNSLRPKITEMTERLLRALKSAEPYLDDCEFMDQVATETPEKVGPYVSRDVWAMATAGLITPELECGHP